MRTCPALRHATALLGLLLAAVTVAQSPAPHPAPAAEQKRGSPPPPSHAPQPTLHPLLAWQHIKTANAAVAAALQQRQPVPPPPTRPSGAGRYVCAVLVCADLDADVPALLGLRRQDVLVIAAPGPFVSPEALALLERTITEERLSLVLVLGHADCRSLAKQKSPADALTRRVDVVRAEAERRHAPLTKTLLQLQRDVMLGASELMRSRCAADELRVFPAELDARSGVVQWQHQAIDAMPLAPVK